MIDISKISLCADSTIVNALSVIDSGAVKIALVVDSDNKLLGTLSDGDIRRGLLKGLKLSDVILDIYFKTPIVANKKTSKENLLAICHRHQVDQIPLIDAKNKVIGLHVLNEIVSPEKKKNKI